MNSVHSASSPSASAAWMVPWSLRNNSTNEQIKETLPQRRVSLKKTNGPRKGKSLENAVFSRLWFGKQILSLHRLFERIKRIYHNPQLISAGNAFRSVVAQLFDFCSPLGDIDNGTTVKLPPLTCSSSLSIISWFLISSFMLIPPCVFSDYIYDGKGRAAHLF